MKTIAQLQKELSGYPGDYSVYAYEGEGTGIVIIDSSKEIGCEGNEAGWIDLEPDYLVPGKGGTKWEQGSA